MQKAIYPGSFDPITYGHLDIIERAADVFDEVVVVIMSNDEKKGTFTNEERMDMVQHVIKKFKNVSVQIGQGLTIDFARSLGANILIRGIRAVTDRCTYCFSGCQTGILIPFQLNSQKHSQL